MVVLLLLEVVVLVVEHVAELGVVVARVQVAARAHAQRHLLAEAALLRLEPLHWVLQPAYHISFSGLNEGSAKLEN